MKSWDHYFHFPKGQVFEINGPIGYDGKGKVIENDKNILMLRLDIPQWGVFPAVHANITLEYKQEGKGNTVIVVRDGDLPLQDLNAEIYSRDVERKRRINSNNIMCSIAYEGKNEIDFDVHFDGRSIDFDFER